jgi:excinuclease UvrABC ATPase subunit
MPQVLAFLRSINDEKALPITRKAIFIVEQLIHIGVGYLSLERPVGTLSGGESQRVKMARQLDCNLVDLLYVLDEPTTGLHPRDTEKLIGLLFELKNRGNSVFVVEHDPEVIKACEWIVDLGPEAGSKGGTVVYNGPTAGIAQADSRTGGAVQGHQPERYAQAATGYFEITNATANNLKNVSVKIPKGLLTCVTGVSGSGKSSLVHECFLPEHPEAVVIDQSPIGRSSRANPLTYTGIFDNIRKEFAAHTGANASLFSFNSAGACPKCNGQGFISYELNFIDAVQSLCDECEGKRYHADVLGYRYLGKNIADVLNLSVEEALQILQSPEDKPAPATDAGRRPWLPQTGPDPQLPVRRRIPAPQDSRPAAEAKQHLHHGRTHHGPAPLGHRHLLPHNQETGGQQQYGHHHRAQHRHHQTRRLDHRHGPRRRPQRRPGPGRRHPPSDQGKPPERYREVPVMHPEGEREDGIRNA